MHKTESLTPTLKARFSASWRKMKRVMYKSTQSPILNTDIYGNQPTYCASGYTPLTMSQTPGTQLAPERLGKILYQQPSVSGHTVNKPPQLSSECPVTSSNINNFSSKPRTLIHLSSAWNSKETVLEVWSDFQISMWRGDFANFESPISFISQFSYYQGLTALLQSSSNFIDRSSRSKGRLYLGRNLFFYLLVLL